VTLTADQILARLEEIDRDLEARQTDGEEAAEAFRRTAREMELRLAKGRLAASGDTQTEKKDRALVAIAASEDDLYERHSQAEAAYEGLKAAIKVLEVRTGIGQSLLKWQRETGG
jgi:hypothetical protein